MHRAAKAVAGLLFLAMTEGAAQETQWPNFRGAAGAIPDDPALPDTWSEKKTNKIFLLSEDGDTFVVEAGPEYKLVGKNTLDQMPLATPAVLRSSLIMRTQSNLYRIAKVRP